MKLVACVTSFSLILAACVASAQSTGTNPGVGFPSFGSFAGSEFDTVNEGNLDIHFSIPVLQKSGRGVALAGKIVYDSLVWSAVGAPLDISGNPIGPAVWAPPTLAPWGWYFTPVAGYVTFSQAQTPPTCPNHSGIWIRSNYTYHAADGTGHSISSAYQAVPADCYGVGTGFPSQFTQDNSGYSIAVDSAMNVSVTTVGGVLIHPAQYGIGSGSGATGSLPGLITDTNGNQVTVSSSGTYTDTLGVAAAKFTGNSSSASITYPSPTSPTTFVGATINYTSRIVQTGFSCFGLQEYGPYNQGVQLVTSIVMADGSTYSFTYEKTPQAQQNTTGRLASITLPSGGTISYVYTGGSYGIDCSDGSTTGLIRTTPDGVWNYTRQITETAFSNGQPGYITSSITTATDPLGNVNIINFGKGDKYESKRQVYTGSSTLLETIETCYNGAAFPCTGTDVNSAITRRTVQRELPDTTGKVAKTDTYLSSLGLVTDVYDYDFGSGSAGPLLKHIATTYASLTANIFYDPLNPSTSYTVGINDRPTTVTVTDGSTTQSQTSYFYDETAPTSTSGLPQHVAVTGSRGNLTTIKRLVQGTTTVQKTKAYFDTGTVSSETDFNPNNGATTYTYGTASCGGAFPTIVTDPPPFSFTVNTVWDCNGAVATSATDENNQPTTYTYGDSNFWRLTQTNYPDGGQTNTTYNLGTVTPWNIIKTVKQTSTQNMTTKTVYDSLARVSQQQLTSDPDGVVYTDTVYDAAGHTKSVSNPYRSTTESTYGLTSYTYDGLHRVTVRTQSDGSTQQTTYAANCTTSTDETGKQRKTCTDGVGRLIQVFEDPTTGGLNYETDYQYDTMGDLICAIQKGTDTSAFTNCASAPTAWRPRSFTYDLMSRLLSATNPESGIINYTYDANGNVLTKVAPQPNQTNPLVSETTNYSYDALNRLTQKTYTGLSMLPLKYAYDASTLTGCGQTPPVITFTNPKGRRTGMCSGMSGSSWSYDPMGRPLLESRINLNPGNGPKKTVGYSYYLDGSLNTLTYPSGKVLTYTVGAAGRSTQATDPNNNYVRLAKYAPQGALASMTNGSGILVSNTYNNRLQPILLSAGLTGQTPILSLCYDFHLHTAVSNSPCSFSAYTSGDNGNVFQIVNTVDSTRSTAFTYDVLNRISQASTINTNSTSCWGETYTIDAWGNLTSRAGVSGMGGGCTTEGLSATATAANQLNGIGLLYDAAGNVTNDGNGHTPTYDAANEIATDAGVTYSYDADGKRMEKSSGTKYWFGPGGEVLTETDLSGVINEEYIYFNGARIARVDRPSGTVHYYFSDHLGSASVITNASGTSPAANYYFPYGGQQSSTGSDPNHYKFTGKERDSESGLDYFEARHYASTIGRFMVPDWAAKPTDVPYANFGNPQSLNLYSYVQNNPTTVGDPDGHDADPCGCGGMTAADYHYMWRDVSQWVSDRASEAEAGTKIDVAKIASAGAVAMGAISSLFFSRDAEAGQLHAAGKDAIDKANATIEKASHDIDSYENRKDVANHIDKLKEGVAQVGELSKQLDKTKSKTERDKVKAKLKAEIKDVNGHEKDLRAKPKLKKTKDE